MSRLPERSEFLRKGDFEYAVLGAVDVVVTEIIPLCQHRVHSDALWEDYSPSANAVIHEAIENAEDDDGDGGKVTLPESGVEVRFGDQAASRSSSSLRNTIIQVDFGVTEKKCKKWCRRTGVEGNQG